MSYGIPTNTHNIAIFEEWCSVRQPLRAWSKWREVLFVAGCGFESGRELADKCSVGHDLANRIIRWAKSIGILVDVGYRKFIAWTALFRPARGKVTLRQLEEALADNGLSFPVADRYDGHPSDTKAPSIGHPSYMSSGNSLLNERTSDVALVSQQPDSQGTTSSIEQPEQQNTQAQQVGCVKALDREEWAESKAKHGGSAARAYRSSFQKTVEERIAELEQCDVEDLREDDAGFFDREAMKRSTKRNWFFNKGFQERVFSWVKAGDERAPYALRKKQEGLGIHFTQTQVWTWMNKACVDADPRRADRRNYLVLQETWDFYCNHLDKEEQSQQAAQKRNQEMQNPMAQLESLAVSNVSDDVIELFMAEKSRYTGRPHEFPSYWESQICEKQDISFGYGQMLAAIASRK